MNRFAKTVFFAILLLVIPMKHFGQTVKNSIIEIELSTISNPDYRYCLLSTIAQDDNISYLINEEEGSLLLSSTSNLDDQQFQAYFDDLRAMADEDFHAYSSADKETQGATFTLWKERLPQDLFVLLFKQLLIENPPHRDGNQTCATADPFCTTDVVSFYIDASVSGSCESGPDYGCMSPYTARPPYWFYMKIGVAGTFTIQITNSNNNDLDFCAWGPFTDPNTPCTSQLTADKIIDCDSPYNSVQECTIPASSQVGQYYLLVITRYSSGSTTVTFSKVQGSGPGETDCGILPPLVNNDGPYCVGETIHLTANGQSGATYSWTGPGGFTSSQQNPTRPNCTMAMAGAYTCTISLGGQTSNATTNVVIHPMPTANFTATTVCKGNPTQFTSTSTTNPSGQQINSYQWNFGDGQTGSGQSVSHTYAQAGNYNATLTVSTGGHCTSTKTQTVTVNTEPVANAGSDQTIPYGSTAQLNGSGGAGTFNFHWEPANMVTNPNAQNTQTVALTQDQTYTLTVTNPQGQCVDSDEVTIHINGSAMTVTAGPNISICQGGSGQIYVSAGGGTGNLTYSWTPTTGLSNPNIYNPIASPSQTTTYTCHVSDGQTSQNASVTVTVNDVIVENEYQSICPDETYPWHGTAYSNAGTYQFDTVTDQGCDKTIYLHLDVYPSYDETIINEAICYGEAYIFYGIPYDYSCQVSHVDHTIHGCDSIVRLNLTVWEENQTIVDPRNICTGQTLTWIDGNQYSHDGDVAYYDSIDSHGCPQRYKLELTVGAYQTPPAWNPNQFICVPHDETPHYHWDIANRDYYDDATDEFIAPGPPGECDYLYTLNLKFHQEFYSVEEPVVECDEYRWPLTGERFSETDHHIVRNFHGGGGPNFDCDSIYILNVTINNSSLNNTDIIYADLEDACDVYYYYNPYLSDTLEFRDNIEGTILQGQTPEGCPYEVNFSLRNMRYTPAPDHFGPTSTATAWFGLPEDPNVPDTALCAAVVTNTEFFSFQYTFYVEDNNPKCQWESCTWEISKPSWAITSTPVTRPNGKCYSECTVYVADRDENLVKLTAIISNECDSDTCNFYLKSSFLDVDEYELAPANVNIVPNPNNGQMRLDFENMEGRTAVKVFDMTGNQIDAFETIINSNRYNYDYHMKHFADGIYFFVVSNNNRVLTKKVVIIR